MRKYKVNEDFFKKWTPEMAYVLGFWFADGYMRKEKSYRIVFFENNRQILEEILIVLGSGHPIKKQDNCHFVSICSKKLYVDLLSLGGIRAKSKTITFPKVPQPVLPDFIRGFFDGDGSVFHVTYKRTKDGLVTKELRTNFTSGSQEFLIGLMGNLRKEIGLKEKILGSYNSGGSLKLGYGVKDSKKLLRYMYYPGFPIGMKRKAKYVKLI